MTEKNPTWVAGPVFRTAMEMAIEKHAGQARKADSEPYLGHLLAVASNVIEAGGTETQAAAALLHDAIEDQGCTVDEIADRVSPAVAAIVNSCSEPDDNGGADRSGTWWDRKQTYLAKLDTFATEGTLDDSVLVALADKVNNCEKTARDLRRHLTGKGQTIETFWSGFNAGDSCQEAWYRGLLAGFRAIDLRSPLADVLLERFEAAVKALFDERVVIACDKSHQHSPGQPAPKGGK
ncbi:MAG: hypothetical protein RLZZ526_1148 [Actinomycetota bacterium]|jgi:hypothetical protein